ncbi:MAG: hypothetical protein K8H88_15995 [Sandaracinaceae bacterium]|nr:hypothetical protein [Sandaracinaceae bacterium]
MSLTTANVEAEASLLRRGRGILANPAFFFIFTVCAGMALVVMSVIGLAGLIGWIMAAVIIGLGVIGYFTGLGDRMLVIFVALLALLSGVASIIVVAILIFGSSAPAATSSGEHSSVSHVATDGQG